MCYLGYDMYDSNMLGFMLCHDRCMIRSFGMIDAMLCVYMYASVCEVRITILSVPLIGLT